MSLTPNHDDIMRAFMEITHADADTARQYLQASAWNMETACDTFFAANPTLSQPSAAPPMNRPRETDQRPERSHMRRLLKRGDNDGRSCSTNRSKNSNKAMTVPDARGNSPRRNSRMRIRNVNFAPEKVFPHRLREKMLRVNNQERDLLRLIRMEKMKNLRRPVPKFRGVHHRRPNNPPRDFPKKSGGSRKRRLEAGASPIAAKKRRTGREKIDEMDCDDDDDDVVMQEAPKQKKRKKKRKEKKEKEEKEKEWVVSHVECQRFDVEKGCITALTTYELGDSKGSDVSYQSLKYIRETRAYLEFLKRDGKPGSDMKIVSVAEDEKKEEKQVEEEEEEQVKEVFVIVSWGYSNARVRSREPIVAVYGHCVVQSFLNEMKRQRGKWQLKHDINRMLHEIDGNVYFEDIPNLLENVPTVLLTEMLVYLTPRERLLIQGVCKTVQAGAVAACRQRGGQFLLHITREQDSHPFGESFVRIHGFALEFKGRIILRSPILSVLQELLIEDEVWADSVWMLLGRSRRRICFRTIGRQVDQMTAKTLEIIPSMDCVELLDGVSMEFVIGMTGLPDTAKLRALSIVTTAHYELKPEVKKYGVPQGNESMYECATFARVGPDLRVLRLSSPHGDLRTGQVEQSAHVRQGVVALLTACKNLIIFECDRLSSFVLDGLPGSIEMLSLRQDSFRTVKMDKIAKKCRKVRVLRLEGRFEWGDGEMDDEDDEDDAIKEEVENGHWDRRKLSLWWMDVLKQVKSFESLSILVLGHERKKRDGWRSDWFEMSNVACPGGDFSTLRIVIDNRMAAAKFEHLFPGVTARVVKLDALIGQEIANWSDVSWMDMH